MWIYYPMQFMKKERDSLGFFQYIKYIKGHKIEFNQLYIIS